MFSITEDAEIYVAELFEQQDEKDLGLKVDVEKAGTPVATVTFNFVASLYVFRKIRSARLVNGRCPNVTVSFEVLIKSSIIKHISSKSQLYISNNLNDTPVPFFIMLRRRCSEPT